MAELIPHGSAVLLLFAQPQHALGAEHCGVAGGDKRPVPAARGGVRAGRRGRGHWEHSEEHSPVQNECCRQEAHKGVWAAMGFYFGWVGGRNGHAAQTRRRRVVTQPDFAADSVCAPCRVPWSSKERTRLVGHLRARNKHELEDKNARRLACRVQPRHHPHRGEGQRRPPPDEQQNCCSLQARRPREIIAKGRAVHYRHESSLLLDTVVPHVVRRMPPRRASA